MARVIAQPVRWTVAALLVTSVTLATAAAPLRLQCERTWLPDSGPSSFAIGFPNGVSFCYDPVRGGLNYIWTGGFLDVTSTRPGVGKLISAAQPLGTIVYRERGAAPLRRGDPARARATNFKGYRFTESGIEFRYALDGVIVREEFRLVEEGLERRFRVEAPGGRFWHVPGEREGVAVVDTTGRSEGDAIVFNVEQTGGEFSVVYRWRHLGK